MLANFVYQVVTVDNTNISDGKDKRLSNLATATDRIDQNSSDRIVKFTEVLKYFEGITMSNKTLRIEIQTTPYQKNYEISSGSSSYKLEFTGENRQFDYLEISLVQDKSDKHKTIRQLQPGTCINSDKKC